MRGDECGRVNFMFGQNTRHTHSRDAAEPLPRRLGRDSWALSLRGHGHPGRGGGRPPRAGHGGCCLLAPFCREALQSLRVEAVEVQPVGEAGGVPKEASVTLATPSAPTGGPGHSRHQHTCTRAARAPPAPAPVGAERTDEKTPRAEGTRASGPATRQLSEAWTPGRQGPRAEQSSPSSWLSQRPPNRSFREQGPPLLPRPHSPNPA